MRATIRAFTEADYPAVVAVGNRSFPEYPDSIDEWRHWDTHRSPALRFQRYVAELDGRVVAYGGFEQEEGMYHPDKYHLEVTVDPDFRTRGVGSALYTQLTEALAPSNPLAYWANVREDFAASLRFVATRGFTETMRTWENHLRLEDYNPGAFAGTIERVEASGIRLATFAELRAADAEFFHNLYDLVNEVHLDVPSADPATSVERERWIERVKNNPSLMPEGYLIAVDGDRFVGLSTLFKAELEDFFYTGLTGVRRDYRRRGIALALKLKALDYARAIGCPLVKTWNASTNTGMLAINAALGFQKQPAWIMHALVLRSEGGAETAAGSGQAEVEELLELMPVG